MIRFQYYPNRSLIAALPVIISLLILITNLSVVLCHEPAAASLAIHYNNKLDDEEDRYKRDAGDKMSFFGGEDIVQNFQVNVNTIIRTQDSRTLGAKYLNETELPVNEDCLYWCWQTSMCNVAVFEEKNKGSCYLFDCGPLDKFRCKFTTHSLYTSSILRISRHSYDLNQWSSQAKHESDLVNLRHSSPISEAPRYTSSIVTTVEPPRSVAVTTPGSKNVNDHSHHHEHRCQHYQFECRNSTECIAIYNVCDGIPQCPDGSDEAEDLQCPKLGKGMPVQNEASSNKSMAQPKNVQQQQQLPQDAQQKMQVEVGSKVQELPKHASNLLNSDKDQHDSQLPANSQNQAHVKVDSVYHNQEGSQQLYPKYEMPKQDTGDTYHRNNYPATHWQEYYHDGRYDSDSAIPDSRVVSYGHHDSNYQVPSRTYQQNVPPPEMDYGSNGAGGGGGGGGGSPYGHYDDPEYWARQGNQNGLFNNQIGVGQFPMGRQAISLHEDEQYPTDHWAMPQPHVDSHYGPPPDRYPSRVEDVPPKVNQQPALVESGGNQVYAPVGYQSPQDEARQTMNGMPPYAQQQRPVYMPMNKPVSQNLPERPPPPSMDSENLQDSIVKAPSLKPIPDQAPVNHVAEHNSQGMENAKPHKAATYQEQPSEIILHSSPSPDHAQQPTEASTSPAPHKHVPEKVGQRSHSRLHASEGVASLSFAELQESTRIHVHESNSAVLALTLGLCITALLLVLVGCRMRTIRRRIARRGRSSLAHDADYLVNGMYL